MASEPLPTNAPPPKPQAKKRRRTSGGSTTASRKKKADSASSTPSLDARPKSLPPSNVLIIDNGGDTLKYGWMTDRTPKRLSNVTARLAHQITLLVGDELSRVQNPNSLVGITRSTERGVICNLGNQTQVWKRLLDLLGVMVPLTSEAAKSLGWKVTARSQSAQVPKTIAPQSMAVLLLLPPHCPRLLLDQIMYVWMEDFGVSHVGFGVSSVLAAREHDTFRTCCSVDLGWSSSLVVPTFRQKLLQPSAVRRLPLGGRHLVNILKYYMSYRQYNLMDQEHLLRDVLERIAFYSTSFEKDIGLARLKPSGRRSYDRDYVLPDYQTVHQGKIRLPPALQKEMEQAGKENDEEEDEEEDDEDFEDPGEEDDESDDGDDDRGNANKQEANDGDEEDDDEEESDEQRRKRLLQERAEEERRRREAEEEEQVLRVSVEGFTVPEVLFRPSDAGLPSDLVGLSQTIVQAISACPETYHAALYRSIRLTGGISQIRNFKQRLEVELRTLVPAEFELQVDVSTTPVDDGWMGAKKWTQEYPYTQWSVSREEWDGSDKRKAYTRLLLSNGGIYQ